MASRAVPRGESKVDQRGRGAARAVVRRYDPSETRTRVLEAAYMLFGTRGYANTGTADIAREADVSEGSIFYHFGSKRALLAELGRLHGEKLVQAMQGDDALENVTFELSINRCFDFCEINNVWDEVVEEGDCSKPKVNKHDPEVEPFFHATREVVEDWTRRHLEAVRHRGDPCIDTEIAAAFIFSLVGDALKRYFQSDTTPAQKLRIRAETVRFCTAAAGLPTGCSGGFNL